MALLMFAAWRAGRADARGAALGLAVACKPFLLPVIAWRVAQRHWREAGVSVGVAVLCVLIGWIVFGGAAYGMWYGEVQRMPYTRDPLNASLFAVGVRSGHVAPALVSCLVVAAVTAWAVWTREGPSAWAAVLLACILISPRGAGYYYLIAVGPLLVAAAEAPAVRYAAPLLWIPAAVGWHIATFALFVVWAATVYATRTVVPATNRVPAPS